MCLREEEQKWEIGRADWIIKCRGRLNTFVARQSSFPKFVVNPCVGLSSPFGIRSSLQICGGRPAEDLLGGVGAG